MLIGSVSYDEWKVNLFYNKMLYVEDNMFSRSKLCQFLASKNTKLRIIKNNDSYILRACYFDIYVDLVFKKIGNQYNDTNYFWKSLAKEMLNTYLTILDSFKHGIKNKNFIGIYNKDTIKLQFGSLVTDSVFSNKNSDKTDKVISLLDTDNEIYFDTIGNFQFCSLGNASNKLAICGKGQDLQEAIADMIFNTMIIAKGDFDDSRKNYC